MLASPALALIEPPLNIAFSGSRGGLYRNMNRAAQVIVPDLRGENMASAYLTLETVGFTSPTAASEHCG